VSGNRISTGNRQG